MEAGNTVKMVLGFFFLVCAAATAGAVLRPVYWQVYATTNPMKDALPKGAVPFADEDAIVPATEEELQHVVLMAASASGESANAEAGFDEAAAAIKGDDDRDNDDDGKSDASREATPTASEPTTSGGVAKAASSSAKPCKPGKGRKCPDPHRVIHANPYINTLPAGRPVTIRQMIRVNQEIAEQTARVRALRLTEAGKADLDAEEELAAQACSTRADCAPGRLCSEGTCVCPIMYSGDANCTSHLDATEWCIRPVTSLAFSEFAKARVTTSAISHISGSRGDLNTKAMFDTCAVVGSSGDLLKSKYGAEIDAHSAVIRFNDAPTKGKEEYVGSKTTLRLQNRYYCGFTEHPGEMCMHYTQDPVHYCENWKKCKVVSPSARTLMYIMQYWRVAKVPPPKDPGRPNAKLSAGFYGVALAAHMCGSVDVYGFRSGDKHYYKKQPKVDPNGKDKGDNCGRWGCGKDKPFKLRHMWSYEKRCLNKLREGEIPRIRVKD